MKRMPARESLFDSSMADIRLKSWSPACKSVAPTLKRVHMSRYPVMKIADNIFASVPLFFFCTARV